MRVEIPIGLLTKLLGAPDEALANRSARGANRPIITDVDGTLLASTSDARAALIGRTLTGYRYTGIVSDENGTHVVLTAEFE